MAAHLQPPDGDFLPYIVLDFSPAGTPIDSHAAALSLLRPLAAGVVRGQGIEASLQRTLLQALLEQGLVGEDGRFGLRPVAHQQAGEAMLKVLPSARPDVAAAYRQPGLGSTDLLRKLHSAGLLSRGNLSGKQATYYSARLHWLQPYGKRPAQTAQTARLVPLPTLPSGPVHRAPAAQHAARQPAAGSAVQVVLQPPRGSGKPRVSPANAISMLKYKLTRGFPGAAPTSQLLQLAVACLLGEGLEKVDTLTFRQHPVSLKAARKAFEQQLHTKSPAVQACYRTQFGGVLLSVLQAPELAGLVQLQGMPAPTEDGWQQAGGSEQGQVQLLLRPPHPGSSPAAAAQQPVAAGPAQQAAAQPAVEADEVEFEGWSFSVEEEETVAATAGAAADHAPPPPAPLPQLAAPSPVAAAQPPPAASAVAAVPGQVTVRAISSEHAAGAAVAALLTAPGGRIGMACEHSHLGNDPGALIISLFAPGPASSGGSGSGGSGGTCYVFELAAMPPADRKAAVRLLAAVLENPQLTKVLHDCRAAAQALFDFPGRSINLQGVIDTQVTHGLAQFLALLGTDQAAEGVDEPVPVQDLLVLHRVSQPSLGSGAAPHAMHAAAAAVPLLALAAALEASLGPVAAARLPTLSQAFSRWDLDLAAFTAVPRPPRQWLAHLLELAPLCV